MNKTGNRAKIESSLAVLLGIIRLNPCLSSNCKQLTQAPWLICYDIQIMLQMR